MSVLTKKVVKDMVHRKLRTILTILGIALGVTGLCAIGIASSQFKASFEYSADLTAQPDIQFYTAPTNAAFVDVLWTQPNVQLAQAQGSITTRWSLPAHSVPIKISGYSDFQNVELGKFDLIEGHLPGPQQIVLESSTRAIATVHIGDQIRIQVGPTYKQVTISGFTRTRGLPSANITGNAQGYMDEQDFESFFNKRGITDFAVRLNNYSQLYETSRQLSQLFTQQQITIEGMDIGRDDSVTNIANGLFAIMNALSAIAILLSVILLLGTIGSLITEQVRYIGIMKAIGAGRGQLMLHYLGMVFLYSLIGTAIGIGIGIFGGYSLATFLGGLVNVDIGSLQVTPWQLGESAAIGLAVPVIAAALPVYLGTQITVHQALSGYGIESDVMQKKNGWTALSRVVFLIFPQTVQFGIRGLFRKRTRAVLTLITLTIAGASFLAVQTASYSFNTLLNRVYTTYHFDVRLSISSPQPLTRFYEILADVNGVGLVEQLSQDKVTTRWGDAVLTGVQLDTHLYEQHVLSGHWFSGTDQNAVLISKDAADKSGLTVGDSISFNTPTRNATWHIIGIVDDLSGVGPGNLGVLLAPITQINAFKQLSPDSSSTVMIEATGDRSEANINALATHIDDAISKAGFVPNVITSQQQIEQDQNKYQIIYILFDAVALIVGLVGAIGLSNSLAMSVLERQREIGILRAMGAASRKVAQVFWTEALMLGILAWTLALLLGFPAAYGFVSLEARLLAPVPFAFDPISLAWMLGAIIVLVSLASVGPVFGAMRVKIVQTLRYE